MISKFIIVFVFLTFAFATVFSEGTTIEIVDRQLSSTNPCPAGFMIPLHNSPRNRYIDKNVSECAVACRLPVYTEDEINLMDSTDKIMLYSGLVLVTILLSSALLNSEARSHYLVICFAIASMGNTVINIIAAETPFQSMFCNDKTEPINYKHGFTMCAVQSFGKLYFSLAMGICWAIQAFGVYGRLVLRLKMIFYRKSIHLVEIFGIPLIFSFLLWYNKGWGYAFGNTSCAFSEEASTSELPLIVIFAPLAVITCIGTFLMTSVILKICHLLAENQQVLRKEREQVHPEMSSIKESEEDVENADSSIHTDGITSADSDRDHQALHDKRNNNSNNNNSNNNNNDTGHHQMIERVPEDVTPPPGPNGSTARGNPQRRTTYMAQLDSLRNISEIVYLLRIPLAFVLCFGIMYLSAITIGISTGRKTAEIRASFDNWSLCALHNYDPAVGDSSWTEICGNTPSKRISVSLRMYLSFLVNGQSIFVSLINFPTVAATWYRHYKLHWERKYHKVVFNLGSLMLLIGDGNNVESFVEIEEYVDQSAGQQQQSILQESEAASDYKPCLAISSESYSSINNNSMADMLSTKVGLMDDKQLPRIKESRDSACSSSALGAMTSDSEFTSTL